MSYPEYAKIEDRLYKINTDFKTAIKCEEVANSDISDTERALAIIFLLFGDDGLNNPKDYNELLKKATIFLRCGQDIYSSDNNEKDMDFKQDEAYIKASFYTDYGIKNIYKEDMHWWEFIDLMNGLKEDCVLNRVRNIRNYDTSGIKDTKLLNEWNKSKMAVALKGREPTEQEKENMENFLTAINYRRWFNWMDGLPLEQK